jgi:hypothetical protein
MRKFKNLIAVLCIGALLSPALESCKKGEEDPGLSLRSRKGRVVGDWKVSNYSETTTYNQNFATFIGPSTSSSSTKGTLKVSYDGEKFITEEIINSSSGGNSSVKIVANGDFKYSFKRDGSFTITQTKMFEELESEETFTYKLETLTKTEINTTIKGTWNFILGVEKDVKNKQFIVLTFTEEETKTKIDKEDKLTIKSNGQTNTTTTTTEINDKASYETNEISQTWELIRLANKELKALVRSKISKSISSSTNVTYSNGNNPYQESSVSNRIEESVITLTLQQ